MNTRILVLAFLSVLLFSCGNDDDFRLPPVEPLGDFQNGLLITNQGPFNNGFGTVSFVNTSLNSAENNIFQNVNDDNLGNVVNAIGFNGNLAYIVANVSNRITVVNRNTFEEVGRIDTGLENPRDFMASGQKGYVTNWGDPNNPTDDFIAVIDLTTNEVTATIPVGEGPEKIGRDGTVLYVLHQGGFGVNNIISVIDTTIDEVSTTITVGDVPSSFAFDGAGSLWVLSSGAPAFTGAETGGRISLINLNTNEVAQSFDFESTEHPSFLNLQNNNVYYYLNGGVYENRISNFQITSDPILDELSFFNMRVLGGALLGTDAGDFSGNGSLEVYDLSNLTLFSTLDLGVIPDQIYIN